MGWELIAGLIGASVLGWNLAAWPLVERSLKQKAR